ncbi:glycosyltransferase family 2 protein [Desulfocurvus sp. DL9XJH121]
MPFPWTALPPELLEALLAGSTGKAHLARCARLALAPEARAADLGLDLLAAAWEHDPLDADLAAQILGLDARMRLLPDALKAQLQACAKAKPRLAPLRLDADAALADADADALARAAAPVREAFPLGADMLLARAHFLAGRAARGEEACAALEAQAPLTTMTNLHAACALAAGDRQRAMDALRASLAARPWQAGALLRLADLASGADMALSMPRGPIAVLLYSWNKAADLDAALASLAASDTDDARILALDNGSTDDTPSVLSAWAHRLGERFTPLTLPCNVGAPAARNWLMSRPEVRASRWTAYLDDDIELPHDWLARLGAAAAAYPEASAWGCKVVDRDAPGRVQNVDLHLREPREAHPLRTVQAPGLDVSDLHLQTPDLGQFAYTRPCASVTGCCHLFSTERLLAAGEFDIRFSPTQFDDLEHDLRMLGAGGGAVYTGHLTVRHARRTGTGTSAQAGGNALGNLLKLQFLYGPDAAPALRRLAARRALDDVLAKEENLGL